ncbi:MAG: Ig-like domain-containing protein [Verrucomicrobia bacterium]|nr:Ig-like domain-containing protein [Verrucomicrobiota bacterium]
MKTIQRSTKSLLVALAACAALSISLNTAQAGVITWGSAQNITGASDVLNTGSTVYAYAFGTDVGPQTVNGVAFSVGGIGGGGSNVTIAGGQACGAYFPLSSPAGYNGILRGAVFANSGSGATMTVTLNNLVDGQQYAVQVWSSNVDYGGTPTTYDGAVSLAATGQYAIGTFTASATGSQVITLTANNIQFNAMQVRTVPAPGTPPTVAITSPTDNATVLPTFTIDATASDDGTIAKVSFFDGTTQLGPDVTDPPYSYVWNGAPEGAHVLTAVAWDNDGMATTSAEVNVTVIDPPTVAITSPANNATVGVNFTIDATATDNGTVSSVDFYDGATLLGSDDTGPSYSYAWNGTPAGPHVLTAVAWDNDGHSTTSAVVNVTATDITWGAAQNITGDSDVLTTGAPVYAYHFGNGGPHSLNGVSFAAAGTGGGGTDITIGGGAPPLFAGPYFGGAPALSAEYTTILLGGLYTASPFGLYSLKLNNLTSGTVYAVQVWSKSPYAGQHITLDGPANDLLSHNGTGQHMIGTFTATSATQTITVGPGVGDSTGGPLCAVQVRTVPVPGTPPTVAITSPADTATVGVNFTIDATASDDGTIASVTFSYSSDAGATWTSLFEDTEAPYSHTWNGAPEGTYQLKAVAVDNDAMSTPSAVVNVTVIDPPTVAITSPADGATVLPTFTIDAIATDNGTITKVDFYEGTTLLGSDEIGSGSTYSYDWNSAPNGLHVLKAVAWDNDGHSTTSAVVNVWVTNITWGSAQNITDDNDVLKTGTLRYAYAFGNGGATVNTVPFAAGAGGGGGTDVIFGYINGNHWSGPYFGPNAVSAEYNTILTGANWAGSDFPLTLSNLTPGTAYTVQAWSSMKHPNNGPSVYTSLDGVHLLGNRDATGGYGTYVGNGGQYATGTFTASGTTQVIAVGGPGKQINAIQVRTASVAAAYEAWATTEYGLSGADALRSADPDGDSFTNIQEFLFGTSPIAGNGALVGSETVGGNFILHWLQRETGSTYLLTESTAMETGSWTTSAVVPVPDDQTGAPTDYYRYKATIPIDAERNFFRVEGTEN